MDLSVYRGELLDFTKEPLFGGTGKNSQRYDYQKYRFFYDLDKTMLGQFWQPEEIACERDLKDLQIMPANMVKVYTRVLQRLIFLDSVQGRSLPMILGGLITNPELEVAVMHWSAFECIHSMSYSFILQSCFADPGKVFDESFEIKTIVDMANCISAYYDDAYFKSIKFQNAVLEGKAQKMPDDLKESILTLLFAVNCLEGMRFFGGFLAIWSMHYSQGYVERTSLILRQIVRDELRHLELTVFLLKILRDKEDEGFKEIYAKIRHKIKDIYLEAYNQEADFIDVIFEDGAYLGLTPDLAKHYLKYICNKRLKNLGETPLFEGITKNPVPWMDSYVYYDRVETRPQEQEVTNYLHNLLDPNIKDSTISKLRAKLK